MHVFIFLLCYAPIMVNVLMFFDAYKILITKKKKNTKQQEKQKHANEGEDEREIGSGMIHF